MRVLGIQRRMMFDALSARPQARATLDAWVADLAAVDVIWTSVSARSRGALEGAGGIGRGDARVRVIPLATGRPTFAAARAAYDALVGAATEEAVAAPAARTAAAGAPVHVVAGAEDVAAAAGPGGAVGPAPASWHASATDAIVASAADVSASAAPSPPPPERGAAGPSEEAVAGGGGSGGEAGDGGGQPVAASGGGQRRPRRRGKGGRGGSAAASAPPRGAACDEDEDALIAAAASEAAALRAAAVARASELRSQAATSERVTALCARLGVPAEEFSWRFCDAISGPDFLDNIEQVLRTCSAREVLEAMGWWSQ